MGQLTAWLLLEVVFDENGLIGLGSRFAHGIA